MALVVVACGNTGSSPGAIGNRMTNGIYAVTVPAGWTSTAETDQNVLAPPTGEGRLVLIAITDKTSPTITADYATEQAQRGMRTVGLSSDGLRVEDHGSGHYSVASEGEARGERVVAAVHVFPPSTIVIGYFYTADRGDPNLNEAVGVLASIGPPTP